MTSHCILQVAVNKELKGFYTQTCFEEFCFYARVQKLAEYSHNSKTVQNLCNPAVKVHRGEI